VFLVEFCSSFANATIWKKAVGRRVVSKSESSIIAISGECVIGDGTSPSTFKKTVSQTQGTSSMTLTKDDLVSTVAEANGYPRNRSVELVETLLEIIKSKLGSGEDVLISGFGKFCVKDKRQRRGRNPATGEDLMLDARRVVTFKCSGQLRKQINQKGDI
jgi:integration host factor subunit alpha